MDGLIKALHLTTSFEDGFADVTKDSPYYGAIGIARKLGIASGVGGNRFNPSAPIQRQEMVVLSAKALKAAEQSGHTVQAGRGAQADQTETEQTDQIADRPGGQAGSLEVLLQYKDRDDIASYALQDVAMLTEQGLLQGDGDRIDPRGTVTRAQAAVLLSRIYQA